MTSALLLPLSLCSRRLLYLKLGERPVAGIKVALYCHSTHTGAAIVEQVYSFSMLVEAGGHVATRLRHLSGYGAPTMIGAFSRRGPAGPVRRSGGPARFGCFL